tara:strand:+ start:6096 stop:7502 length:1407 start_codon:yes stop_codon:yes gene_type:complete
METRIHVDSLENYKKTSLIFLESALEHHFLNQNLESISKEQIQEKQKVINSYKNLSHLKPLDVSNVEILDEKTIDTKKAELCVLKGKFFWEHACAGEATRLGLGTKYLLNCKTFSKSNILGLIKEEISSLNKPRLNEEFSKIQNTMLDPADLLSLSLGARHMLQMHYDIKKLAVKHQRDVQEILGKQKMLIILNKKTAEKIITQFKEHFFFGFNEKNVYFMIQEDFHGIEFCEGKFQYDSSDLENKRLHNHGQMMMQKMHNESIFHFINSKKVLISQADYLELLKNCEDMVSFNIEDTGYLTNSIDFSSLAKALELGSKGYNMIMEIVGQNPIRPQKGGAAFFDPIINKNVMIESPMLGNIKPEEITFLNKNFNHYPNPFQSMMALRKQSLHMPIKIKKAKNDKTYIYFEPVQGDMNFLVNTAFLMRKELKPIQNWKSPLTTPSTLLAMQDQDNQIGFKELAQSLGFL